jgi:hypothetical protein
MVIHTITFGSDADKTLMKQVAQTTGGLHYHAPTGDDLINCYRLIALTLKTVLTD